MTEDPAWLTPKEAAAYLRTSRRNFDRLKIARHIIGMRTPRFLKTDLDAYMASRRVEPITLAPLRAAPLSYTPINYVRSKSGSDWRKRKLAEFHRSRTATASSKSDGAK
jgi:hypothetical protein